MMEPNREQISDLLKALLATKPKEIDCDQFLTFAGALADSLEDGQEVPTELSMAFQHLEICPECREEFEALLKLNGISTEILGDS